MDKSRILLMKIFRRNIENLGLNGIQELSVCIVGGSDSEPELQFFSEINPTLSVVGVDVNLNSLFHYFLDLNNSNEISIKQHDLVICNQVLEHVHNLDAAFTNLKKLTKPGGYIWISVPSSNFRHGSPDYYSAGYSREFLEKFAEKLSFSVLDIGEISNHRLYTIRHLFLCWPNNRQLSFPLIAYFGIEGSIMNKIIFNLKILPHRVVALLSRNAMEMNGKWSIETYAFLRRD